VCVCVKVNVSVCQFVFMVSLVAQGAVRFPVNGSSNEVNLLIMKCSVPVDAACATISSTCFAV
jgi:hypothetical protein